jgi:hypothetical protein
MIPTCKQYMACSTRHTVNGVQYSTVLVTDVYPYGMYTGGQQAHGQWDGPEGAHLQAAVHTWRADQHSVGSRGGGEEDGEGDISPEQWAVANHAHLLLLCARMHSRPPVPTQVPHSTNSPPMQGTPACCQQQPFPPHLLVLQVLQVILQRCVIQAVVAVRQRNIHTACDSTATRSTIRVQLACELSHHSESAIT